MVAEVNLRGVAAGVRRMASSEDGRTRRREEDSGGVGITEGNAGFCELIHIRCDSLPMRMFLMHSIPDSLRMIFPGAYRLQLFTPS